MKFNSLGLDIYLGDQCHTAHVNFATVREDTPRRKKTSLDLFLYSLWEFEVI